MSSTYAAKFDPQSKSYALAPHAGGFGLYDGLHILTLVTEVATRTLKAVRYQKFNNHIGLRPETLATRIQKPGQIEKRHPLVGPLFSGLQSGIADTVSAIRAANKKACKDNTAPANGLSGRFADAPILWSRPCHGRRACVTILKAVFDTGAIFLKRSGANPGEAFRRFQNKDVPIAYMPNKSGYAPVLDKTCPTLTLEGELDKLAANISIARNMASVHNFSDNYDSLRMGEEIALHFLEEQALCCPTDPFVLMDPTIDGRMRSIGRRSKQDFRQCVLRQVHRRTV